MNTPQDRNELREAFMQPIGSTRIGEPVREIDLIATPQESVRERTEQITESIITSARLGLPLKLFTAKCNTLIDNYVDQQREAAVREVLEKVQELRNYQNDPKILEMNDLDERYAHEVKTVEMFDDLLATYTKSEGGE